MKSLIFALLTLTMTAETFAQRSPRSSRDGANYVGSRGRAIDRPGIDDGRPGPGGDAQVRYGNPSRRVRDLDITNPRRPLNDPYGTRYDYDYGYRSDYGTYRPEYRPRYIPHTSRRIMRSLRRPHIVWSTGFGYQCSMWGELLLNGRMIHSFISPYDCNLALSDIRLYGDFCNGADLYDQTGILEGQFNNNYECREALGWYY